MNLLAYPYMSNFFSPIDMRPPTLYRIMNSLANFDEEDKTQIPNLASVTHTKIFNFSYPISTALNKDDFEILILNHFIMRRIGFETMTAFQIALNVKLNTIMPMYNKMFEALEGWNLFNDGEEVTRTQADTRTINNSSNIDTTSNTNTNNIVDNRYSNTPQNKIQDVKDGSYMSEYTLTDSTNTGTDTSNSKGTSNSNDNYNLNETIKRTPHDKIRIYKDFVENRNSIYNMIFNDLESLFYQLI